MKDIVKSIKDNATSRLKNPIVGAFVLAWAVLNINGISLFMLGDSTTKIEIIKGKSWGAIDDFVLPLIVAITYLIALPILNMLYEHINDGWINFHRYSKRNIIAKELAIQKRETVIAEIEADKAYIQKQKDKDIHNWIEQKTARNNEFIALKERYSKLVSDSTEDKRKALTKLSEANGMLLEMQNQNEYLEKEQQKKQLSLEQATNKIDKLINNIENKGNDVEFISNDLIEIRAIISSLRLDFNIWDDDIPF